MQAPLEALNKGIPEMMVRMTTDAEMRMREFVRIGILKHVRPLYVRKGDGNYFALGSGVLVVDEKKRKYFLCSAAHVFDEFAKQKAICAVYELTTFGQGATVLLPETPICTHTDRIDLGVLELSAQNVEQIGKDRFLSLGRIDPVDTGSYRKLYCALGYPANWNDRSWVASPEIAPITPKPLVYGLTKSAPAVYSAHKIDPSQNIMVAFRKKKSHNCEGQRIHAPHPYGMSGGGLWHFRTYDPIGNSDGPIADFRLVGILIEWQQEPEGMIATRSSILREFLAARFP